MPGTLTGGTAKHLQVEKKSPFTTAPEVGLEYSQPQQADPDNPTLWETAHLF